MLEVFVLVIAFDTAPMKIKFPTERMCKDAMEKVEERFGAPAACLYVGSALDDE
jgi:hypothetical protein